MGVEQRSKNKIEFSRPMFEGDAIFNHQRDVARAHGGAEVNLYPMDALEAQDRYED
ncbi:hypothetical protein SAMN05444159_6930 [Bradyrhizobium lablabi]|uniref:Uncharacterized protein n=1 Tax=Bradyrhizobium lablabi TaxID=722472 RepID=A0A1M7DTW8_9BRAD|nr:hypothetical protein [Bradyrhizobium lablabi]SHL82932.1 hypothetical protein SAMN05444159_6930 [Bradyrhizobium lablabi]